MDRDKQLKSIIRQIVDEFNDMIQDPSLDFDFNSACGVAGELFSQVLLSAHASDDQKVQMAAEWLKQHLRRVFDDHDAEYMGQVLEECVKKMDEDFLTESVEAEGPGKGN